MTKLSRDESARVLGVSERAVHLLAERGIDRLAKVLVDERDGPARFQRPTTHHEVVTRLRQELS